MPTLINTLFAPGFFQSSEVQNALLIATAVAAVSGAIGVFVIVRGQTFVGDILTDVGMVGAAASFLIGLNAWYGFLSFGLLAGTGTEVLSDHRAHNRDVATGIILSFATGLGALFLYFDTHYTSNASASMLILFGSLFVINPGITPIIVTVSVAILLLLSILYRPLLMCSVNPDIARARGVPIRFVSIAFMILLATAVENGALVIGTLLSTALLIGPAATAIRLTSRMEMAVILSAGIGVLATWIGTILAYDSYLWPPAGRGWPVSFFIPVIILVFFLLSRLRPAQATRVPHSLDKEVA